MALYKHGMEKQLKEREAWLNATLNSIGDAVIATDTGGSITNMNPMAAKLTGWTFKEAEGKPLAEVFNIVNARTRKKAVTPVKKVLEKGKIVGLANHTMLIAKDGTEHQIAGSASSIRDSAGNNMGMVLVFRNMTEEYRIQEALRESEEKMRAILDASPDIIHLLDVNGIILSSNEGAAKRLGLEVDDLLGKSVFDYDVSEETMRSRKAAVDKVFRTGEPLQLEDKGLTGVFESHIHPVFNPEGEVTSVAVYARDITKRIQAEQELLKEKTLLKTIIDRIPVLLTHYDPSTNMLYLNKEFEKIIGWKTEEVKNIDMMAKFYPDPDYRKKAAEYMQKTSTEWKEFRVQSKSGKIIDSEWSNIRLDDGTQIGIGIDITERKRTKEELENIFNLSPDMVAVCTTEGKFLKVNPSWEKVLGYTQKELLDLGWLKLVHPDDVEKTNKTVKKQLKGSSVVSFVNRYKCKDGSYKIFEWQATSAKEGIHATARDITKRIQAEKKHTKQQYYLTKAQEMGSIGTWELDLLKNELIWTDQNYRNFGVPLGTPLTYEIFLDSIHPDDRDYVNTEWIAALTGKPYDIEHRLIFDDKVRWVREKADVEFDKAGKAIKAIGFTQDITKHKQAEEAMAQAAREWQTTFDTTSDVIWVLDKKHRILQSNKEAERIFQQPREMLIGKNCCEIVHGTKEPLPECPALRAKKSLKRETLDLNLGEMWYQVIVDPILDAENQYAGLVHIISDITERKRAEEEIRSNLKEKEAMLKEIHHRVKNNMQIISSLLRLQLDKIQDEEARDRLKRAGSRIRSIALVHEELYKSENLAEIDFSIYISRLATHILSIYSAMPGEIDLELDLKEIFLNINTAIPLGLVANELISNSVVHGFPSDHHLKSKKSIKNKIMVSLGSDEHGKRIMEISDNGVGIPRDLDHRKADTLGLQIVMDLVKQTGGTIKLYRKEGTTWRITF